MTQWPSGLTRGQNIAWPHRYITITCQTATPIDVSLLLLTNDEKVRSSDDLVFYNTPSRHGAQLQGRSVVVSLDEIPCEIEILRCLASVDPGAPSLAGACPLLILLTEPDEGTPVSFPLSNLTSERAVVTVDVYRRGHQWKVRAVGQGWDDGLAGAVSLHGVEVDDEPPTQTPAPDATDASSERALQHIHGILDDLTSSAAAKESARDYAAWRLAADLERIAEKPSLRGPPGDEQRNLARQSHDETVGRADAQHHADLKALQAEISQLESVLPAPLASLSSKTWKGTVNPGPHPPRVIRLGSLTLRDQAIGAPMLSAFPGRALVWLESTHSSEITAGFLHGLIHRLLTCSPVGSVRVDVVDLTGAVTGKLQDRLHPTYLQSRQTGSPLVELVTTVPLATAMLNRHAKRVDLAQMAVESGVADALEDVTSPLTLLVMSGFPVGLGTEHLEDLRRITEAGALAGVQTVLTAEKRMGPPFEDGSEPRADPVRDVIRCCLWLDGDGKVPLSDAHRTRWAFRPDGS